MCVQFLVLILLLVEQRPSHRTFEHQSVFYSKLGIIKFVGSVLQSVERIEYFYTQNIF